MLPVIQIKIYLKFSIKNLLPICVKSDAIQCGERGILFSSDFVFLTGATESFVDGTDVTLTFGIPFDYTLTTIRYDDADIGIPLFFFEP